MILALRLEVNGLFIASVDIRSYGLFNSTKNMWVSGLLLSRKASGEDFFKVRLRPISLLIVLCTLV